MTTTFKPPLDDDFYRRWSEIADLPLPSGVGDLEHGLCVMARIGYARTGKVTDAPPCVPGVLRSYLIALNDSSLAAGGDRRQQLGTLELAQRILAADTSPEAEQRRAYICADTAVRQFAVRALNGAAGKLREAKLEEHATALEGHAKKLAELEKIDSKDAAARAARAAAAAADDAADAACAAARAAAYAAARAADAARAAAYAAARAADAAADASNSEEECWKEALALLDALIAA